jgi:hypothetical protein
MELMELLDLTEMLGPMRQMEPQEPTALLVQVKWSARLRCLVQIVLLLVIQS